MKLRGLVCSAALVMGLLGGCDDDDGPATPVAVDGGVDAPAVTPEAGTGAPDAGGNPDVPAPASKLYDRLGGEAGIRTVVTDFVVNRVLKDAKINGYFLNRSVDGSKLIQCLVLQVGSLTGGPQVYPSAGCRDMKSSHKGLKISMQDFNDLAGHLVDALKAVNVAQADIDTIVSALVPMADDIVEDKTNNATVYQRLGRKPAIATVIGKFITEVVADARINGFFGRANAERLQTCLVRQVCSIDGPCKYGQEVDGAEPGVSAANACRDMKSSHVGLTNPPAGGAGITKADFDALVEDLVKTLDAAGVPATDKMAILSALAPTCGDIVAGGTGCPGKTIVALTGVNTLVTFDSKTPGAVTAPVAITGLAAGETVVGITLRPANGKLYGLGSSSRLYELDRMTGAAKAIGAGPFTPALEGVQFGFDFNPTVDRIRVTSNTGQNLRLHPDMGTVVDGDANAMGVQPDTALTAGSAIGAVAYTNSFAGATTTTLYALDTAADVLAQIGGVGGMPSPNAGLVTRIGPLGVDAMGSVAFDVAPSDNMAYAALSVGGVAQLYTVDVTKGTVTLVGPLPATTVAAVRGITVLP
ncbi:MAG TPA: DUF4394 domain-containing protein [Polyangia bacterium]